MASASTKKKKSSSESRVLETVDRRQRVDETIPLTATILTYKILDSHVEYNISVQRGPNPEDTWNVSRRYNEFDALNQCLKISGIDANLPPKKMFRNTDKQFLNERQLGLQEYLIAILRDPFTASSLELKRFLDPVNHSQNYHEIALRNVSMFFRSNPEWEIVEPLRDIGWRINKHYYLIGSKVNPSTPRRILTWIDHGPDFRASEIELEYLLKVLVELKHPNVVSPISATYNGTGLLVTRDFYPHGTLRDTMHKCIPKSHYLTKNVAAAPLDSATIRRYGRQILDTLQFLHAKGFVLGQLHSGNIIVDHDVCRLIDLENCLMGLPSFYRMFLLELRKIQGAEAEIVYSFGHLLYEMASGKPLKTVTMESLPSGVYIDPTLSTLLQSLLSTAGVKSLPTLKDLIENQFFVGVTASYTALEKPYLKVSSAGKEVIRSMREVVDARLQEDQRKLFQSRRMSKARQSLMSEEEKKKRQKKIRKQMTQEASQKEPEAYPTSDLKRQLTIPSSQAPTNKSHKAPSSPKASASTSSTTTTTTTSTSAAKTTSAPPPPSSQPPEPRPATTNRSTERGALLSSIEGFRKGKLKKALTNDRSGPML